MKLCYRLLLCSFVLGFGSVCLAQIDIHVLESETLRMELTPNIGGRVLFFGLKGKENFLKVSEEVQRQPNPEVTATAENIGYFGHENWVGPQSAWWVHQTLNEERKAAKAVWPPDPWLILATNKVLKATPEKMVMQSPHSPISGVQMRKTYSLDQQDSVQLDVEAKNIREEIVAWGLWFNTRVEQNTAVYVPVAFKSDIHEKYFTKDDAEPYKYLSENKMLVLDLPRLASSEKVARGKLFIQPSEGWMAAFRDGQVFIIRFPLQPLKNIHPEQGQVELYYDYHPNKPIAGVIEMELHGMYRTLPPGETVAASELWTILPYTGDDSDSARVKFLRKHLDSIYQLE